MKISPMKAALLMARAIATMGELQARFALSGFDITPTGKGRNRHHHMRKSWFSETSQRSGWKVPHQGKRECARRAKRMS